MTANSPETVSSRQAAAALGISRAGVSYLVQAGRIASTRDVMGRLEISLPSVVSYGRTRPNRKRGPRSPQTTA